jgi:Flp pilus assembly protein TadD
VQADPQFTKAWKNLGMTLDDLGRHDEAVNAYRQVTSLNPDAK